MMSLAWMKDNLTVQSTLINPAKGYTINRITGLKFLYSQKPCPG